MEAMIKRLGRVDNEISSLFQVMLMNSEDTVIDAIKKQYPRMVQHFVLISQAPDDIADLLKNDNVYKNFLIGLPANMAVDPTIGFQLVKDVLNDLGFETQYEFTRWSKSHPTKFLNYLRSSVTCIQAYFDLEMHPMDKEENTVVDFIFRVLAGDVTQEEEQALTKANNEVNSYIWD